MKKDLPTLLVLGGGTGAEFFNKLIWESLQTLCKSVQIIHSTGKGKLIAHHPTHENYHAFEFITNMADAYAAADFVLARAGVSTITELSNLKKISIIIPMPKTHQEFNAWYVREHEAAVVLKQKIVNPPAFTSFIRKLIFLNQEQEHLKKNIGSIMQHGATAKIADIVIKEVLLHNG